jgi:uncharacterized membrane protein
MKNKKYKKDNQSSSHSGALFEKVDNFFSRYAGIVVSFLTVGYCLLFSYISILRYNAFEYIDFDLAIFSQITWNILDGSIYSSILGVTFLGNHLNLILFLLAPIYRLFSTPLALLLFQTIFIGLGVIPLYLLARNILGKSFAFIFSLIYLTYPALHFVNRYEFHPVVFVTCFLLFMFYYFEKSKFGLFSCFMFLSLLCKENISLVICFFGLYVLFFYKRGWKWCLLPLITGSLWFIAAVKLMPYFNKGTLGISGIYSHLGDSIPGVIFNIIKNPFILMEYIFTEANMKFLFQLLLPLAFLSLFAPKILFIAFPFFLQQLLSQRITDQSIHYHYTAKLIPFLFIAAIYGTRVVLKSKLINRNKGFLFVLLLATPLISNINFGFLPKLPGNFSSVYKMEDIDYAKQKLIDAVPKESAVAATFEFLPKLSHRQELYSFHHVYKGEYTLSSKEYVLPQSVEYAVIDFNDRLIFNSFFRPDKYKNLQKFFNKDKWGVIEAADNIVLLKKGHETNVKLFQKLEEVSPLNPTKFIIEKDAVIWGYKLEIDPANKIHISLIWECLKETDRDYWVAFKIIDEGGKVLHGYNHPVCYSVYPTYSWKKGDIFQEDLWMVLPSEDKLRNAELKMNIFMIDIVNSKHGLSKGVNVGTNAKIFDQEGWASLGKIGMN